MMAAMTAFNWIVGLAIVGTTVWIYPDHSPAAIAQWALLYLVAIAAPYWWYRSARRYFQACGLTETPELRTIAARPIVASALTLVMAFSLIFGSR
jgi:hypothetical protein